MSIERYPDFESARRALWVQPGDPSLTRRIRSAWAFAHRLAPGRCPRGVQRFRSIEEAGEARDQWTRTRIRELRESRIIRSDES